MTFMQANQSRSNSASVASQAFGQIDLLSKDGSPQASWIIRKSQCSVGSGSKSDIVINHPTLAESHLTIRFGKNHTLLKAIDGETRVGGKPIREWLIDESTIIQCGSLHFLVHPSINSADRPAKSYHVTPGTMVEQAAKLKQGSFDPKNNSKNPISFTHLTIASHSETSPSIGDKTSSRTPSDSVVNPISDSKVGEKITNLIDERLSEITKQFESTLSSVTASFTNQLSRLDDALAQLSTIQSAPRTWHQPLPPASLDVTTLTDMVDAELSNERQNTLTPDKSRSEKSIKDPESINSAYLQNGYTPIDSGIESYDSQQLSSYHSEANEVENLDSAYDADGYSIPPYPNYAEPSYDPSVSQDNQSNAGENLELSQPSNPLHEEQYRDREYSDQEFGSYEATSAEDGNEFEYQESDVNEANQYLGNQYEMGQYNAGITEENQVESGVPHYGSSYQGPAEGLDQYTPNNYTPHDYTGNDEHASQINPDSGESLMQSELHSSTYGYSSEHDYDPASAYPSDSQPTADFSGYSDSDEFASNSNRLYPESSQLDSLQQNHRYEDQGFSQTADEIQDSQAGSQLPAWFTSDFSSNGDKTTGEESHYSYASDESQSNEEQLGYASSHLPYQRDYEDQDTAPESSDVHPLYEQNAVEDTISPLSDYRDGSSNDSLADRISSGGFESNQDNLEESVPVPTRKTVSRFKASPTTSVKSSDARSSASYYQSTELNDDRYSNQRDVEEVEQERGFQVAGSVMEVDAYSNSPEDEQDLDEEESIRQTISMAVAEQDEKLSSSDSLQDDGEESEESIEAYMQRLLERVKGGTSTGEKLSTTINPPVKPRVAPKEPPQPSANSKSMIEDLSRVEPAEIKPIEAGETSARKSEPIRKPRVTTAEEAAHLDRLRELANHTARSAITVNTIKRIESNLVAKIMISAIGFLGGVFLLVINQFAVNIALVGMIACFAVFLIWGYDAMTQKIRLAASREKVDSET